MIKDLFLAGIIYAASFVIVALVVSTMSYHIDGVSLFEGNLTYQEQVYLLIGIITGMFTIAGIDFYKNYNKQSTKGDS